MAPPRASRLATRKSLAPDPHLYNDSLDSDEEHDRVQTTTTTNKQTRSLKPPHNPPVQHSQQDTLTQQSSSTSALSTHTANTGNTGTKSTSSSRRKANAAINNADQQQQSHSTSVDGHGVASATSKRPTAASAQRSARSNKHTNIDDEQQDDSLTADQSTSMETVAATVKNRGNKRQRLASTIPTPESEPLAPSPPPPDDSQPPTRSQQPARSGFRPRAVPKAAKTVPPKKLNLVSTADTNDDDDDVPFNFSTNPPTPHAKKSTAGKAPARAKGNRKGAIQDQDLVEASGSTPRRARSASAPIHVHETPVQIKNIAFRQGDATPGSLKRSVKRSSVKGSGRRGSSIGGGFEAVPHPQVPDHLLYRSTDGSEPVARRLRSILSWTAQRQRDRVFKSPQSASSTSQTIARQVIDSFITDICDSRLDVSVSFKAATDSSQSRTLPPHPQNESNAAKLVELEQNYAAIAREQNSRDSVKPTYQAFEQRRIDGRQQPLPPKIGSDHLQFDLSTPAPTSIEDALTLGQSLLQSAIDDSAKAKGKRRKTASRAVPDALSQRMSEVSLEVAEFRHLTHRLEQFSEVASSYIATRQQQAHHALGAQARHGLNTPASLVPTRLPGATGDDTQTGPIRTGIASAVGPQVVASAATASASTEAKASEEPLSDPRLGSEPRDLLRAIAQADQRTRR